MLLLGLDFETTGLDTAKDMIIEVGAVLWDTVSQSPKVCYSDFVLYGEAMVIPPEITDITGISLDDVLDFGKPPSVVLGTVLDLLKSANFVVAHNGTSFDKPLFDAHLDRLGIPRVEKIWLDTMTDIEFPASIKTSKLTYLAAEHGFVNPFAHRAVFDVMTMMKMLAKYDIYKIIANNAEPKVLLQAICRPPWEDAGQSTNIAKEHGFRWEAKQKKWLRRARLSQYGELKQKESLHVVILAEEKE